MKTKTNGFFQFLKEVCYEKEIKKWYAEKGKEPTDDEIIYNIIKEKITNRIINTLSTFKAQFPDKFNKIYFRVNDWFISLNLEGQGNNVVNLLSLEDFSAFCHEYPIAEQLFKEIDNKIYGITISKSRRNSNDNTDVISASYISYTSPTQGIEFKFKHTDETFKINEFTIREKEKNDRSILKVHLHENKITNITKCIDCWDYEDESPNQHNEEELKQELKKILFGDETNKNLTKNIELELNSQQKEVFEKIKQYIGIVEEKEEENKEEEEEKKEESNQKKPENIDLWNSEIKENQYDAETENDIHGQDMKFEKTEESPMCNCECWNNLKSWCSKFCSSETTMD